MGLIFDLMICACETRIGPTSCKLSISVCVDAVLIKLCLYARSRASWESQSRPTSPDLPPQHAHHSSMLNTDTHSGWEVPALAPPLSLEHRQLKVGVRWTVGDARDSTLGSS